MISLKINIKVIYSYITNSLGFSEHVGLVARPFAVPEPFCLVLQLLVAKSVTVKVADAETFFVVTTAITLNLGTKCRYELLLMGLPTIGLPDIFLSL